jgi:ERCC4-type nuclease
MVEINIDTKEPIEYKLQALQSGDLSFRVNEKLVRIERKNYADLLHSSSDNRLAIQLNQLKADCDFPILAIVGYPNIFNLIDRCALRNLLLSIKLTGVIVERYDNEVDYKARIPELVEYFKDATHFNLIPYRYSNPKLSALMWVQGIGYKKAADLLDTWQDSLIDIYNAPKSGLTKILGSTLADRFYNAIRKPVKQSRDIKKDLELWD